MRMSILNQQLREVLEDEGIEKTLKEDKLAGLLD